MWYRVDLDRDQNFRALSFGLGSGSGFAKLGLRAQNQLAHYIKIQNCESFGCRALLGLLKNWARAFSGIGLM